MSYSENREWSDWGERHGRKSREAAVREMGIDRIQLRFANRNPIE
jgi:hypothetical protein